MKNKSLFVVVAMIVALVLGSLFFSQNKTDEPLSKDAKITKIARIGVLQYVTHASLDEIYQGIKDGLKEEGFEEGANLEIEFKNAEGDQSQVQTLSKALATGRNELLIGIATPAAQGLANATSDLPIVMGAVTDPVGANLMKDLKQPDGNITGVSDQTPVADEIALIKAITPKAKKIGILYSSNEDNSKVQVEEFTKEAEVAGYSVEAFAVPSSNEIASTVQVMTSKVDVIFTPVDNTIASAFSTVVSVANKTKTPIYTSVEEMVKGGGLASVTINQHDLGVATGKMAARILKGEKVENTPVEIFNKGTVVVNQKVADQLGIELPEEVIKKASRVIK